MLQHQDSADDLNYLCFFELSLSLSDFFLELFASTDDPCLQHCTFFASNHCYKSMLNCLNLIRNIFLKKRDKILITEHLSVNHSAEDEQKHVLPEDNFAHRMDICWTFNDTFDRK